MVIEDLINILKENGFTNFLQCDIDNFGDTVYGTDIESFESALQEYFDEADIQGTVSEWNINDIITVWENKIDNIGYVEGTYQNYIIVHPDYGDDYYRDEEIGEEIYIDLNTKNNKGVTVKEFIINNFPELAKELEFIYDPEVVQRHRKEEEHNKLIIKQTEDLKNKIKELFSKFDFINIKDNDYNKLTIEINKRFIPIIWVNFYFGPYKYEISSFGKSENENIEELNKGINNYVFELGNIKTDEDREFAHQELYKKALGIQKLITNKETLIKEYLDESCYFINKDLIYKLNEELDKILNEDSNLINQVHELVKDLKDKGYEDFLIADSDKFFIHASDFDELEDKCYDYLSNHEDDYTYDLNVQPIDFYLDFDGICFGWGYYLSDGYVYFGDSKRHEEGIKNDVELSLDLDRLLDLYDIDMVRYIYNNKEKYNLLWEKIEKNIRNENGTINQSYKEYSDLFDQHSINESVLSDTKTKQQAIHKIYKLVKHDGFYNDEGWNEVHRIADEIRDLGAEVDYYPTNDSHTVQGYPSDGSMKSKSYDIEIRFTNALGKDIEIRGQIVCSGAGTVDDPLSRYDVVLMLG